jgi:hypothetical protein
MKMLRPFQPWWSPPGETSEDGQWFWSRNGWLYNADTLIVLLWVVLTEWEHDRHLVG